MYWHHATAVVTAAAATMLLMMMKAMVMMATMTMSKPGVHQVKKNLTGTTKIDVRAILTSLLSSFAFLIYCFQKYQLREVNIRF